MDIEHTPPPNIHTLVLKLTSDEARAIVTELDSDIRGGPVAELRAGLKGLISSEEF